MSQTQISTLTQASSTGLHSCLLSFSSQPICGAGNIVIFPSSLDLGAALAAFGLIFAVYQLRRSKWDIALRIRSVWERNLFWVFGGMGLFLTLLGVLITQFPEMYLPYPLNFTLFYELLAYLFFIASPISLLFLASRTRGLFNRKTSRKFYEVMVQEISRSTEESLNALLEVLLRNFDAVCKAAVNRDPKSADFSGDAISIIEVVLSDESIVRLLTTKRLDGLLYIFGAIEHYRISRRQSGIGVPRLMSSLFYDDESFFYKQLDNKGLALSSNVYTAVFKSPILLTNFDLFGYPTLGHAKRKDTGIAGIEVLIKALSEAIETYLKTGAIPPRHINNGFEYLADIFADICIKLNIEERRGIDTKYALKDEWWSLGIIADFLGHGYLYLANDQTFNTDTVAREKTAQEPNFYSDLAINEGVAAALYKCMYQLSYIKKSNDTYHTVQKLLHGMIYDPQLKEGYRAPFEKRMWEQIGTNVIRRYYPAALRSYLIFIGFYLASGGNQKQGWIGEQAERMRRLLYIDLKPLLDAGEKMVNEELMKDTLLPDCMSYEEGKFTYTLGFGEGKKVIIAEPPSGSGSALSGVNLDNLSSII